MSSIFYALFDVFDYELLILSPSRRRSHKALDQLLEKIDVMVDERREEITKNIQTPSYQAIPDSQKDILTLMIEAELQGEGRLTNEELRVSIHRILFMFEFIQLIWFFFV
jgi:cytochrome P450